MLGGDNMNEKMMQALSELDWLEALKTASQLKEIAEYYTGSKSPAQPVIHTKDRFFLGFS